MSTISTSTSTSASAPYHDDDVSVVKVGPVTLTVQAAPVLALGAALTACFTILGLLWHPIFIVFGGLPVLAFTVYMTYVTNCVVVGHCHVLSWFFVGVIGAYTVLTLATLLKLSSLVNRSR